MFVLTGKRTKLVKFDTIMVGDAFECNGQVFIKRIDDNHNSALLLGSHMFADFDFDQLVTPVVIRYSVRRIMD